jgi:hypothetical protein
VGPGVRGRVALLGIRAIAADGAQYYQLKNVGARAARGDVVALLDTDVVPDRGWLAAVDASMEAGVDFSAGISHRSYSESAVPLPEIILDLAGSISWGFVLGAAAGDWIEPRGFLSHNIAFRRPVLLPFLETYLAHQFPRDQI